MPRLIKPLTSQQISGLKPKESRYRKAIDNDGLYIEVRKTGKSWMMRNGSTWTVIGDAENMPMATARQEISKRCTENTPGVLKIKPLPKFKDASDDFIKGQEKVLKSDKNLRQWTSTIKEFALPVIGSKPVDLITPSDIKEIVNKAMTKRTDKALQQTASKLRGRLERIIDAAWIEYRPGVIYSNPATSKVVNILSPSIKKRPKVQHHKAIPTNEAPLIFQMLWDKKAHEVSYAALCFVILTIGRASNGSEARWDQIKGNIWNIEGGDMKSGADHRVTLPKEAMELLKIRKVIDSEDNNGWVFPSKFKRKNMPTDNMLNALQRTCGIKYTTHGWRTTFKQWAVENGGNLEDDDLLSELALAHSVGAASKKAYFRTTLMEKRAKQLQDWAKFLTS